MNELVDLLIDVLNDSLMDTLKLVPFLFLTYLAMEALEHGMAGRSQRFVERAGVAGPVVGAALGALPQCGFSAMAATLFSGRVITVGTLVAVLLSTSDEMIPVFVAHQVGAGHMMALLLAKVVIALVVGFALDAVVRLLHLSGDGKTHIHELCERAHCHCDDDCDCELDGHGHEHGHEYEHDHKHAGEKNREHVHDVSAAAAEAGASACCGHGHEHGHAHAHGHGHEHGHGIASIARSAVVHSVQVAAFIFVISIVMGLVMELVGQDTLATLAGVHPIRSVLVAAAIGLIPNCGASVAVSELYLAGTFGAPAALAGLLTAGGVGLLVLFRTNANARENLAITAFVYVVGVACGLLAMALGVTF